MVNRDGWGSAHYRTYNFCDASTKPPCDTVKGEEIIDGGRLRIRITKVVTAHHQSTATAIVEASTDGTFPPGSKQVLVLDGDVIDSPIGTLCDRAAERRDLCGA